MKKVAKLLVGVIAIFALGCTAAPEVITTESGLSINVLKKGDGVEIPTKQMLLMNLIIKDATDSVILSTYDEGATRHASKTDSIWYRNRGGIEEVLYLLTNGDSVNCNLTAEKLYGNRMPYETIKPKDTLNITIKLEEVMTEEKYAEYMSKLQQEAQEKVSNQERKIIENYLAENGIEALDGPKGLKYVIHQEGEGEIIKEGQQIKVNYTGHVLNGDFFDSSIKEIAQEIGKYDERREPYGPAAFTVGQRQVIEGWELAFQLMKKGSKATLYIPSGLGYGARAISREIKANSILVFDVEVTDVITEEK